MLVKSISFGSNTEYVTTERYSCSDCRLPLMPFGRREWPFEYTVENAEENANDWMNYAEKSVRLWKAWQRQKPELQDLPETWVLIRQDWMVVKGVNHTVEGWQRHFWEVYGQHIPPSVERATEAEKMNSKAMNKSSSRLWVVTLKDGHELHNDTNKIKFT